MGSPELWIREDQEELERRVDEMFSRLDERYKQIMRRIIDGTPTKRAVPSTDDNA